MNLVMTTKPIWSQRNNSKSQSRKLLPFIRIRLTIYSKDILPSKMRATSFYSNHIKI